ncbi:MAG: hypothetical protein HY069_05210, partial [Chlamydiia bacterium]|nr:hypothetical protein [Chlamydiia bacterium]
WFASTALGSKSGTLLPLWGYPNASGQGDSTHTASFARGKWILGLNVCDLEMGRSFWVGKHFSLRPFIGARGAWIDQHFHIRYDLATSSPTSTHIHALSDFSGGGIRAGTDMRFTLIGGWSFYSVASASLLYGFYNCDFHEQWDGQAIADAKNRFRQGVSNGQLELGVRWDTYLHRDRYHIGLYAGWEQNIWFGMNKMSRYFGSLDEGNFEQMNADLTLSGGTFGVRFDF